MKVFARSAAGLLFAGLVGCSGGGGGGGGGGAGAVQFNGNTNPALITTSNAGVLAADATNSTGSGSDVAQVFSSAASGSEPQAGQGLVDVGRRVSHAVRDAGRKPRRTADARATTSVAVDETAPCPNGGSVRVFGDLPPSGFGTINVTFSNCAVGGDLLNGTASLRIDRFTSGPGPEDVTFTDITVSTARLSLRGSASLDIGGQIRVEVDQVGNKETITQNIVAQNFDTGRTTRADIVVVDTYDNLSNPTSFTESISGKVFNSTHGFVDIVTLADLRFPTLTQPFPSGGELVLSGQGNQRVHVLPNSSTRVTLGLDFDGNVGIDRLVRLAWTELGEQIGSDLGDDDNDGMHNSWEKAFGLNPNLKDDAAVDPDSDGFTNLAEYVGGGNPGSNASKPALVVGAPVPAATDIAIPDSNTEMPGKSAIAFDGKNFLLVSCRQIPTTGIFGAFISESGRVLAPGFFISGDACPQRLAVAFDGTNYLVVVVRNGQLFGIRVGADGSVPNPAGDLIASSADNSTNFLPSVAFDGTNYLVVWRKFIIASGSGRIHGAIVTTGGVVQSEFPITSGDFDADPKVAFGGGNYLVAWTRGSSTEDVFGSVVSPLGSASAAFPIATLTGTQFASGVAFDGTNFLVVWDHAITTSFFPPPDGQIFGRQVATNGTLLGATATDAGIPISTGLFQNHSSSVAFTGSTFVVTWAVGSFSSLGTAGIYAARVSKGGQRIDGAPGELGVPVSGSPGFASLFVHPIVAANRASGLIAWVNNEEAGPLKDVLVAPVVSP